MVLPARSWYVALCSQPYTLAAMFRVAVTSLIGLWLTACGGRVLSGPTPPPHSLAVILPSPTLISTLAPSMLTPEPTSTPAPTPAPIIHIVQPGDTLLGIALQYNITLAALQQVNGVLKPETLQIGQKLIIPVPGVTSPETGGGLVLPTPTPVPLEVQHMALYQTSVGSVWVLGEVLNPGDTSLENVQVRASLLSASGVEAAAASTFVALDAVPPGGRSPFGVLFDNAPAGTLAFQVTAIRAEPSRNADARYVQLQIINPQPEPDGSRYRLTGSIANTSSANALAAQVVVTLYDANRRVVGYRQALIGDGQLPAGSTAPFDVTVSVDPSAYAIADYAVEAQGRVSP